MQVDIKQGLLVPQTSKQYLQLANKNVHLMINDPVRIVFTHGPANYLIEETETVFNAWKIPDSKGPYWLYWDIDTDTAIKSFGYTAVEPLFGTSLPSTPVLDQHYFDKTDDYMKVWNGLAWIKKIRVFAGAVKNTVVSTDGNGSQVDIDEFSIANPIKIFKLETTSKIELNDGNYMFITDLGTNTQMKVENYRLERLNNPIIAGTSISKSRAVCLDENGHLMVASYANTAREAIGVTETDVISGQAHNIITKGFYEDKQNFNFSNPALTPVFVGLNGFITPDIHTSISTQKVGYIVSPHVIFIDIKPQIIII